MQQQWLRKHHLKSVFKLLQTLPRFFHLIHYVKCWWIFGTKGLYQSSGKEKEGRCLLFTSSTKREIRQFQVLFVQQWQRNVWKSMMLVQSCCFAKLKLSLFCCSRCHHHRSCLRSLICNWPLPTVGTLRPGLATLYVFWSFRGKLKKLLMYENLLTGKNFLTAYKICVHK